MTKSADDYFLEGCGRCSLGGTPACKVHRWSEELSLMRQLLLECGLNEESKWGMPCYTYKKKNVVLIGAFKEYCSFNFFKGALLTDAASVLEKPGENSQSSRLIRLTDTSKLVELYDVLKSYVFEAIELEMAGKKVELKQTSDYELPSELQSKFAEMPELKIAFDGLTPGRQRAYILHFAQPKQQKTRESRIEKCIPKILSGKGFLD